MKISILIGIMPYLTKYSKIINKDVIKNNKLFLNIFTAKQIKNNNYRIDKNNFNQFSTKFKELLYYKWEFIPNNNLINNLRYIINKYYNDYCLEIFDKSLNLNYYHYINENKKKLFFKKISNLMSKFFIINFFIENLGIYEKEKCIGKGFTGRVSIIYIKIKLGL